MINVIFVQDLNALIYLLFPHFPEENQKPVFKSNFDGEQGLPPTFCLLY